MNPLDGNKITAHKIRSEVNLLDDTEKFMKYGKQLDNASFDDEIRVLRIRLLEEEFEEYINAEDRDDLVEVIDGLLDIIVIAWGTLLSYVGPKAAKAAAMEVARSNLEKVIGEGLPLFREDGKIIKPEGWRPPQIADVLTEFDVNGSEASNETLHIRSSRV